MLTPESNCITSHHINNFKYKQHHSLPIVGALRGPPRGVSDVPPLRAAAGLLRDARLRPAAAHVPRPVREARLRRRRRVRLDRQDNGKHVCLVKISNLHVTH